MVRRAWLVAVALVLVTSLATPVAANDSLRDRQWGLEQVDAPSAWPVTRGAGTTVAIVDSGLDLAHPEFANRIVDGVTFIGCPTLPDGCGDGDLRSGGDPEPSVHGTHVAGIVAAVDDGHGVTGVAPEALLLSVKVLAGDGEGNTSGTSADIAAGIRWATRNGADVINLSLGERPGTQTLRITGLVGEVDDAVRAAADAGVVVVGAAGNEFGVPACDEPAFHPEVVCVVATDRFEDRAVYSNLAVDQGLRVLAAPGGAAVLGCAEDVLSVFPVGTGDGCPGLPSGYGYLAGTSMAAPHVAGVAAMLVSTGLRGDEVVDRLLDTARNPITGARGSYDPTYGYGILDAHEAVGGRAPTVVRRHAGDDRIGTAVAVSRHRHPDGASAVVLARADDYADALAGAPLAAHERAPLLLTARDRLSDAARDEVQRLGADTAYLLGGEAALAPAVADQLRDDGIRVERVSGPTRWSTAAAVAGRLPPSDRVYVAEGDDPDPQRGWPDALSASGIAAAFVEPVLLTLTDSLPSETAAAIGGDTDVVVVGGPTSVSRDVEAELARRARSVRRLAGDDRYATSVAVAEEALARGASTGTLWLASGLGFPDGLAAGAAAGSAGATFVLVHGRDLDASAATRDHIAQRSERLVTVHLAGGPSAISSTVEQRIRALVG